MKKTILLLSLMLVSIISFTQTTLGVRAGTTLSKYGYIRLYDDHEKTYAFKLGVHIGAILEVPIKSSEWSFTTGLYLADKGTKYYGYSEYNIFAYKATESNYRLEVPLVFTYKISLNKNISLKPQMGVFVAYTMFGRAEGEKVYKQNYSHPNIEISYNYLPSDGIIGVGANAGIAFIFKNLSFTYSCDLGLPETVKSEQNTYYNENIFTMLFSLGYNF